MIAILNVDILGVIVIGDGSLGTLNNESALWLWLMDLWIGECSPAGFKFG